MSRSAKLAVQKMLMSRLPAAITAAGLSADVVANPRPEQALPYVQIGEADENDAFRTLSTNGSVLTATVRVWAESIVTASQLADTVIQDQTDRSSLPSLDSPFVVVTVDVQSSPTIPNPAQDGTTEFQIPVRLRYQIAA